MMNQSDVTGREVVPTSASNSTQNYNLPLFVAGDKPSWDIDFNGAMNKIDTVMHDNAENTSSINSTLTATQDRVTKLETRADNNDTVVDNLNTLTGQHSTDISSLQTEMDTVQNDLITQNTAVKQAQTDIAKLKTDVSGNSTEITSLDNRIDSVEETLSGVVDNGAIVYGFNKTGKVIDIAFKKTTSYSSNTSFNILVGLSSNSYDSIVDDFTFSGPLVAKSSTDYQSTSVNITQTGSSDFAIGKNNNTITALITEQPNDLVIVELVNNSTYSNPKLTVKSVYVSK